MSTDSDDESDIEVILDNSPPVDKVEDRAHFRSASGLRRANNSMFELNVSGEQPNSKRIKRVETKDVAIQCTLVPIEDLIDSEPIPELDPYVFENSNITFASEVIDIEDSDDDCQLID